MKKSKILAAILLAAVMVFSVVSMVACNENESRIELLMWAPSNAQTFYKKWAEKWAENYTDSQGRQFKVKMGVMGEGLAGTEVMNAPEDAADVFCFADDQVPKLVGTGALASLGKPETSNAAKTIAERNSAGSVAAATYNGQLYAYPMQADNGYFLYYNSDVLTTEDIASWESLFAKLATVNEGKTGADRVKAQWSYGEAWYQASFFYTFGGTVSLTDTNFDSAEVGIKALKAAHWMSSQQDIIMVAPDNATEGLADGTIVAAVAGSWIYESVSKNDKIKLAVLPSITVDGDTKPMKAFLGSKLMGVNGQGKYQEAAHSLANYLTNEEVQTDKITALSAGPSNINAAASDTAQALPTLAALAAQSANSVPQSNLPDGFFDALPTCVNAMNNTDPSTISAYYDAATGEYKTTAMQSLLDAMRIAFKLAAAN